MRKVFEILLYNVDEFVVSPEGVLLYRAHQTLFSANPASLVLDGITAFRLSNNGTLYACTRAGITVILNAVDQIKNKKSIEKKKINIGETHLLSISPDNKRLVATGRDITLFVINEDGSLVLNKVIQNKKKSPIKSLAISSRGDVATLTQDDCKLYQCNDDYSNPETCGAPTKIKKIAFDRNEWLHLMCEKGIVLMNTCFGECVRSYFAFNVELIDFSISADGFCYMLTKSDTSEQRHLHVKSFISEFDSHGGFTFVEKYLIDSHIAYMYPTNKQAIYFLKNGQLFLVEHSGPPKPQVLPTLPAPQFEDPITQHAEFIVQNYYLSPFPNGEKRGAHGALHVCRAAILGMMLVNLYRRQNASIYADINEKTLKLIQIALLFHDAGRQAGGEDLWDRDSALLGYRYVNETLKLGNEEARLVADAIANKDSYEKAWILHADLSWSKSGELRFDQRQSHHVTVHEADCVDNKRTKLGWHDSYMDFEKYFLADEDFIAPSSARQDLMSFLDEVDQFLFFTGDSLRYPSSTQRKHYNSRMDCYALLLDVMRKNNLSNLEALYADGKILSVEEAQALKIRPRLAEKGPFYFKKFISDRPDYGLPDFLLSFTRSPINVERRPLRIEREVGPVFSLRAHHSGDCLQYEVQELGPAAPPMYSTQEKKDFSKATGLCYADPRFGFFPRVYAEHKRDEIGFLFPPKSVLINRIFGYSGKMSTYYRFYERDSREKGQALLSHLIQNEMIFYSLEDLVHRGRNDKAYQVMGRLSYTKGMAILLFRLGSEEACKNAEIAAAFLERRITIWAQENRIKLPQSIQIPILYYLPTHPFHLQEYTPQAKYWRDTCIQLSLAEKELALDEKWGATYLHLQAANNRLPEPEILLNVNLITLNRADKRGRTPLFYAAQNAQVYAMLHLILAGATITHLDNDGKCFIDLLFQFRLFVAFDLLLKKLEGHSEQQKSVKDLLFSDHQKVGMWKAKIARHEKKNPELRKLTIFN